MAKAMRGSHMRRSPGLFSLERWKQGTPPFVTTEYTNNPSCVLCCIIMLKSHLTDKFLRFSC